MKNNAIPPEIVIDTSQPVYGGFWQRVLAVVVESGFSVLIIPIFFSVYYYFRDGQTLGYKVMGLAIYQSPEEKTKPTKLRLLTRWLLKGSGILILVSIIRFIVYLSVFTLDVLGAGDQMQFNIIHGALNWILGLIGLIGLLLFIANLFTIPFHQKKKGVHDIRTKTVVHKINKSKTGRIVVGLFLYLIGYVIGAIVETASLLTI